MSNQDIKDAIFKIKNNIEKIVKHSQKQGGKFDTSVKLLSVSKKQSAEKIRAAFEAGQIDFGENYVQEAELKHLELVDLPITWHFIGKLQKNKVKDVVGKYELIHSVDSLSLAEKISQKAKEKNINQKILIEVNIGDELSKTGFSQLELLEQFNLLTKLPHLVLSGLMILPPMRENVEEMRPFFKELRSLFEILKNRLIEAEKGQWLYLSMGTSHDYEVAIQEGANIVRIGTAIFGERV